MTEWTRCPQCGLRHSVRADGLCPRCRKTEEARAAAEPRDLGAALQSIGGGREAGPGAQRP
jgi:hypothetical protein